VIAFPSSRRVILPALAVGLAFVLAGCSGNSTSNGCDHSPKPGTEKEDRKPSSGKQDESAPCCCEGENTAEKSVPDKVELKAAKYDRVMEAIRSHKGKVVVLDIWADWCLPCKMEFPGLVKLHVKYAKDGVVCVSLSLDKDDGHAAALDFLKKKQASFANFRLDEEDDVWQEKFNLNGPPAVLVFDPTGKLAHQFDHGNPDVDYDYGDVEKLVKKLLAKK
jgi:thiol-disulfide isomerase/thioredoxin